MNFRRSLTFACVVPLALAGAQSVQAASLQEAAEDLGSADLSALMDIKVTSASKRTERLATSSSAVTVITAEEISRMPVTRLEDIFRTVPGMSVAKVSGNRYAIGTRGSNNQFAGSLLVMIDGRTIFSPVFSGVLWDGDELPLDEIARIEIVRGPGATLWGANAVNGVINIITKSAATTQGGQINVGTGSMEQGNVYVRYGMQTGTDSYLRLYGSRMSRDDSPLRGGGSGRDQTAIERTGLRYDSSFDAERSLRVTAEAYRGMARGADLMVPTSTPLTFDVRDTNMAPAGGHVLGQYSMPFAGGQLHVQGSLTRERRRLESFGLGYDGTTADVEVQHDLDFGSHRVIWGAGGRNSKYSLNGSYTVTFTQSDVSMSNYNLFIQDEIGFLDKRLRLTGGAKLEHGTFTGSHILPTLRLLYAPDDNQSAWAAVSRATQTPSLGGQYAVLHQAWLPPGCVPLVPGLPCGIETRGGAQSTAARVDSLELGYRSRLSEHLAMDVAAYTTRGQDLPSADFVFPEFRPGYIALPIQLGQLGQNRTHGLEATLDWQVQRDFRLRWGSTWYWEHFDARPSALSVSEQARGFAGTTPHISNFLRGSHDFGSLTADWTVRHVSKIDAYSVDPYTVCDLRIGWNVDRSLELILTLDGIGSGKRYEAISSWFSQRTAIEPEWAISAKWRF